MTRTGKSRRWWFANTDVFRGGKPSEIIETLNSRRATKRRSTSIEYTCSECDAHYLSQNSEVSASDYHLCPDCEERADEISCARDSMFGENDEDDQNLPDSYYESD